MPEREGTGRVLSRSPIFFWLVAVVLAAADLVSKHLIFQRLPERESAPVVMVRGFFHIVHSENRGGVFGLGQGLAIWLVFGLIAGAAVVWFAHRKDARAVLTQIALGLVLGGAIGNLYDRVVLGYVRDFVVVYYWPGKDWPAFNVADAGICVGAGYLAVYAFFFAPREDKKKA